MVSFGSSTMKNIVPCLSWFPVKLISCIVFGSSQVLAVYLNLLLSPYSIFLK